MAAPQFATDIRTYLVDTVGLTDVTIGFLAANPINQYAVIEYPGPPNAYVHGAKPGVAMDNGNVQVMVRNSSAQTALTNIMGVVDALDGLQDATINGVKYSYVNMKGRPRILDRLEDGTIVYIAEFYVRAIR